MALFANVGAAELPLALDLLHSVLALLDGSPVVLDVEPPVLRDVPKVRPDGRHTPAATGDLDHDLRCPAHGGFNPAADRRGPALAAQAGSPRRDDPVSRVEQALAPLDEDAVDRWL